jgi:hypothetical protein
VQFYCFGRFIHAGPKKYATPQGDTAWREKPERSFRTPRTFQMETLEYGLRPSGGLSDYCLTEVLPIDIRAKVFAAHDAICRLFNLWAMFCRDFASTQPVVYYLGSAIDALGERALRSCFVNCSLKCCHAKHIKHVFSGCQHLGFVRLNKSCNLP